MPVCPPAEQLRELLEERLSPGASDALEGHLAECAVCRRQLEALSADDSARRLRALYEFRREAAADPELRFLQGFSTGIPLAAGNGPVSSPGGTLPPVLPLPQIPGYEILRELGRGGMGVVYQARQLKLKRLVAMKVILAGSLAGSAQRNRFLVEAETLARLRHPNIVQIYEADTHDGCPFLALEYIEGGTLADRLRQGALPPDRAAELVETLACAIHAAHQQGVVHRDLKPANILLQTADCILQIEPSDSIPNFQSTIPKIADFGLAKWMQGQRDLTQTGFVAGTPQYMAPEQTLGERQSITRAVDVYALGAILYHALTGRAPFEGAEPAAIVARLTLGETPSLSGVSGRLPRDLVTICEHCLAAEPRRRYPTAEALADDLRCYLRGEPVRARPVGELERIWKWTRRHRALAAALGVVALALTAGTAISVYFAIAASKQTIESHRHEADAVAAREEAEDQAARAEFARGFDLALQGEEARGRHSMLAALRRAPPGSVELQRVLRTNLAAWTQPLFDLRQVIPGEGKLIGDLAFSPDGQTFAAIWENGVQLYETARGRAIGGRLHCPQPRCFAFSADGRKLAVGSQTGALGVWDVSTGVADSMMPAAPKVEVRQLGFSRDRRTLFTAHSDGKVRLWDSASRQPRNSPLSGVASDSPVLFSPDGLSLFAVTLGQRRLRRWDVESGRHADMESLGEIGTYMLLPDGATIVTYHTGVIERRDLQTGRRLSEPFHVPGQAGRLLFTPDGSHFLVQDHLGAYVLWGLTTHRRLGEVARLEQSQYGCGAVFSPDGRYLLTFELPSTLRIWKVNAAAWQAASRGAPSARTEFATPAVTNVVFTPDGRTAALLLGDRTVQLWDTVAGQPAGRPLRHPYRLHQMVFDRTGQRLAASCFADQRGGGAENAVQVWDVATQAILWSGSYPLAMTGVAFSPDGQTLAIGGYAGSVHLLDPATGRERGPELRAGAIIHDLLYSPDGSVLAAGCWNTPTRPGGVQFWDVAAGRLLTPFLPHHVPPPHSGSALNAEVLDGFTPDGRRVLTHGGAGTPIGPQGFATFQVHDWEVCSGQSSYDQLRSSFFVRLSPDGRILVTADWNGRSLHIRDVATGKLRQYGVFNLPTAVGAVSFTPDSRLLAVGYGNQALLWDISTGLPIGPPVGHASAVVGTAFIDESRTLLTVSANGWLRRWPVPAHPSDDLDTLAERLSLCTQSRVEPSGALVYFDGPALTQCWRTLEDSANEPNLATTPADWHEAAAAAAEELGDGRAARVHLQQLVALQPDVWRVYARLARLQSDAGEWEAADATYSEALRRTRPTDLSTWYAQRAAACAAARRVEAALWYMNRLIAAEPNDWRHYADRAEIRASVGQTAERERDLAAAVARGADGPYLVGLAHERAQRDRWQEASDLFERALARGPHMWDRAALAALRAGDAAAYRRVCSALLAQTPTTDANESNNRAAVCALGPDAVKDWAGPLSLAHQAVIESVDSYLRPTAPAVRHAYLNTQGSVLFRAGIYAEAIAVLKKGIEAEGGRILPEDALFLAMAHHRLGRRTEAQAWLDRVLSAPTTANGMLDFWGNLEIELLRSEATQCLSEQKRG
jgi:WD40 repeat protein/tetratricopeptide (TPR) repeat protein/tRNA A-37 threonylcarbamoyl transferase component Bud32